MTLIISIFFEYELYLMEDLRTYELEVGSFDKNFLKYNEEIALFENNNGLGILVTRIQKSIERKSGNRL